MTYRVKTYGTKNKYLEFPFGEINTKTTPVKTGYILELLKDIQRNNEFNLTCRQTSEFVDACRKNMHDAYFDAALRDFTSGEKFEVQRTILSIPIKGKHVGIIAENEETGNFPDEFDSVPLIIEDYGIVGGTRNFAILCESAVPLDNNFLEQFKKSKRQGAAAYLERDEPQLGLPSGTKICVHTNASNIYSIVRGVYEGDDERDMFTTNFFSINADYGENNFAYREIIPKNCVVGKFRSNLAKNEFDSAAFARIK